MTEKQLRESIPHASGDEPLIEVLAEIAIVVYPTQVGMNRTIYRELNRGQLYTPRKWG